VRFSEYAIKISLSFIKPSDWAEYWTVVGAGVIVGDDDVVVVVIDITSEPVHPVKVTVKNKTTISRKY